MMTTHRNVKISPSSQHSRCYRRHLTGEEETKTTINGVTRITATNDDAASTPVVKVTPYRHTAPRQTVAATSIALDSSLSSLEKQQQRQPLILARFHINIGGDDGDTTIKYASNNEKEEATRCRRRSNRNTQRVGTTTRAEMKMVDTKTNVTTAATITSNSNNKFSTIRTLTVVSYSSSQIGHNMDGASKNTTTTTTTEKKEKKTAISSNSFNQRSKNTTTCTTIRANNNKLRFPVKLFYMIQQGDTEEYADVCHWSHDGRKILFNPNHPNLETILCRHFNHSRWLSFSRQLNNYGFVMDTSNAAGSAGKFKCYYHSDFHQGIQDPMILDTLLPYLPTKRKNDTKAKIRRGGDGGGSNKKNKKNHTIKDDDDGAVLVVQKGRKKKTVPPAVGETNSTTAVPTEAAKGTTANITKDDDVNSTTTTTTAVNIIPNGTTNIIATASLDTVASSLLLPSSKTRQQKPRTTLTVDKYDTDGICMMMKTEPTKQRQKLLVSSDNPQIEATSSISLVSSNISSSYDDRNDAKLLAIGSASEPPSENGDHAFLNCFKTPSPQRRSKKTSVLLFSPPSLVNNCRQRRLLSSDGQKYKYQQVHEQKSRKISSVPFEDNHYPLPDNEPTPRTSNISSLSLSSPDSNKKSRAGSPPDGVKMLSWAAKAVESPLFNGDKKRSRVLCLLAEAIDHSPIVPPTTTTMSNSTTTTQQGGVTTVVMVPPLGSSSKSFNNFAAAVPTHELVANITTTANGSTPIFYDRYHHQHTEVDLELLRDCLENVFSDTSSSLLPPKQLHDDGADVNYY